MKMNLTGAIEILKLHKHTTDKFKHSVGDQYVSDAIDTVVAEVEKPTYTAQDMESAWESGCLVGCEQENDIIYNREKSNYLTFERWIEGREK